MSLGSLTGSIQTSASWSWERCVQGYPPASFCFLISSQAIEDWWWEKWVPERRHKHMDHDKYYWPGHPPCAGELKTSFDGLMSKLMKHWHVSAKREIFLFIYVVDTKISCWIYFKSTFSQRILWSFWSGKFFLEKLIP